MEPPDLGPRWVYPELGYTVYILQLLNLAISLGTSRIFTLGFWYTLNFWDWAKAATAGAQAAQGALTTQSARLREMNAALGAQLLAEKGAVQDGDNLVLDLQNLRVKISIFHPFSIDLK